MTWANCWPFCSNAILVAAGVEPLKNSTNTRVIPATVAGEFSPVPPADPEPADPPGADAVVPAPVGPAAADGLPPAAGDELLQPATSSAAAATAASPAGPRARAQAPRAPRRVFRPSIL